MQTPSGEKNLPGPPAISYRTGTWATCKESMLARLSSSDYPALSGLKTRDDNDFSVALLDASSVVLDILTFYQERLANESYLRTATQLRSLTELSRLIGYAPAPGVSASVYLAFSLKAATGLPSNPSTPSITIPKGTQAQSVPARGQSPQTFETSEDILAKADWNALRVQTGVPWVAPGPNWLYLAGTSTQLNPGDALLILGVNRETWNPSPNPSEQWDIVILNKVEVDKVRNLTYVAWDQRTLHFTGDGTSGDPATWKTAKIFALRQRAALFGHNAPDPNLFVDAKNTSVTSLKNLIDDSSTPWRWRNYALSSTFQIDLDTPYSKIVVGGWFALVELGLVQLYKVKTAFSTSRASFGMSGKITRLVSDFEDPSISVYHLDATAVLAQSEQLIVAEQPFDFPLYGTVLDLHDLRPDLINIKAVALSGKNQKLSVNTGVTTLEFDPDDGSASLKLKPGNLVTLINPTPLPLNKDGGIPDWNQATEKRQLRVADSSGRNGTLNAALADFTLAPAGSNDPVVQEFALVSSVTLETAGSPHTRIHLQSDLMNCYDRTVTTVNANVGLATNGRSVSEVLGNGSAATPNQNFTLKQSPLTFIQAPTPSGRQSTLQVTANGVAWAEAPTLYQQGPSQQVFSTLNQPGGITTVRVGDGVEGATLPTGKNNIHANYRVGSGLAGNVNAGSITTLVDRPLGVTGVNNPQGATGGQDPQSVNDVRGNAPLSVLTLGRAVSITDYQNFASSFAGIAKAYAIWIPSGPGRGVFLTVAGAGGAALAPGNPTLDNLVTSLRDFGSPLVPINAVSFLETLFSVSADIRTNPAYDHTAVMHNVRQALTQNYSFANRTFGQGVSADEVAAFIQAVPGVIAVNVTSLEPGLTSKAGDIASGQYSIAALNSWLSQTVTLTRPASGSPTRICPYLPVANFDGLPQPAEILVLDPDPKKVSLGVMV